MFANSTSVLTGGYSSSQNYSQQYDTANYWQSYSLWQSPSSHSFYSNVPAETSPAEDDLELIGKLK